MSPTFSIATGITSWWVMVCGNSVQAWPSTRVSSPEAIASRTASWSARPVGAPTGSVPSWPGAVALTRATPASRRTFT